MVIICALCGRIVPEDEIFCPGCGTSIPQAERKNPPFQEEWKSPAFQEERKCLPLPAEVIETDPNICAHCGRTLRSGQFFCLYCGNPTPEKLRQRAADPKK